MGGIIWLEETTEAVINSGAVQDIENYSAAEVDAIKNTLITMGGWISAGVMYFLGTADQGAAFPVDIPLPGGGGTFCIWWVNGWDTSGGGGVPPGV